MCVNVSEDLNKADVGFNEVTWRDVGEDTSTESASYWSVGNAYLYMRTSFKLLLVKKIKSVRVTPNILQDHDVE